MPLVTFGVPVRNEGRHLRSALDSLLGQDHRDLEVIVSDNASTDDTGDIAREYAKRDARVRYVRHAQPLEALDNFWAPLGLARGEYFAWAAGHDLWDPAFARRTSETLEAHPDAALCYP